MTKQMKNEKNPKMKKYNKNKKIKKNTKRKSLQNLSRKTPVPLPSEFGILMKQMGHFYKRDFATRNRTSHMNIPWWPNDKRMSRIAKMMILRPVTEHTIQTWWFCDQKPGEKQEHTTPSFCTFSHQIGQVCRYEPIMRWPRVSFVSFCLTKWSILSIWTTNHRLKPLAFAYYYPADWFIVSIYIIA